MSEVRSAAYVAGAVTWRHVRTGNVYQRDPLPLMVRTHHGGWIAGTLYRDAAGRAYVRTTEDFLAGFEPVTPPDEHLQGEL